jgi:hypothetical protein
MKYAKNGKINSDHNEMKLKFENEQFEMLKMLE